MIKINLLAERRAGKPRAGGRKRPKPTGEGGGWQTVVLVLLFLGALAVIGEEWWRLSRSEQQREDKKVELEERLRQLEKEKELFEQLQAKKARKEQRVALLRELKENKQVPVYVLQQVNDALGTINQGEVQSLWLTSLSEDKQRLTIGGRANTFNDVSDLWNRFNDNPVFDDVTLGQTIKERETIRFSLDATILPEEIGGSEGQGETASGSAEE